MVEAHIWLVANPMPQYRLWYAFDQMHELVNPRFVKAQSWRHKINRGNGRGVLLSKIVAKGTPHGEAHQMNFTKSLL